MIEVNHITKRFGKVTAVDDFTLDINRGSVLGIVGSNGGGKSTLLRILSGVFDADSGEVKINGQNIYNNPSVKGECFFIPDFLYTFLSVLYIFITSILNILFHFSIYPLVFFVYILSIIDLYLSPS